MQKALKSHHYPKKQDNPSKWIFLLLINNLKKLKTLISSPLMSHAFLDSCQSMLLQSSIIKTYTPQPIRRGASLRTSVIDYILQKFNPYLLSLSFLKLSRAHSQKPFPAYSHHNTNIHHLAYTFLLHKRPITDQPSYHL